MPLGIGIGQAVGLVREARAVRGLVGVRRRLGSRRPRACCRSGRGWRPRRRRGRRRSRPGRGCDSPRRRRAYGCRDRRSAAALERGNTAARGAARWGGAPPVRAPRRCARGGDGAAGRRGRGRAGTRRGRGRPGSGRPPADAPGRSRTTTDRHDLARERGDRRLTLDEAGPAPASDDRAEPHAAAARAQPGRRAPA